MPEFIYEGMDNKGKEISGSINAESKVMAINKIREMGYFPTLVTENKKEAKAKKATASKQATSKPLFGAGKVKEKDLVTFMRQFATLVDAGLPILRCLRVLEKQQTRKGFRFIVKDVGDNVESGNALSTALTNYQNIFSSLFVNMVRAGEVGGVLDRVLLQMADYFEKSQKLKKKVISSMVYPICVLTIALAVVYFLVGFIIPKFAKMFIDMDLELPGITQFLIDLSKIFKEQWYIPPLVIVGIVVVFKIIVSNKQGRHAFHTFLYRFPLVGDLVSKVAIARFSRTLGTLIESGVPILEAIQITVSTVGNSVVEKALMLVHDNLREGESMVQPLTQANVFPPMVLSMIAVGEETGRISEMLIKIAESHDEDVDATISGLTSLIEPILIVGLAGIVAFIVIAMFLPLVSLISSMSG